MFTIINPDYTRRKQFQYVMFLESRNLYAITNNKMNAVKGTKEDMEAVVTFLSNTTNDSLKNLEIIPFK